VLASYRILDLSYIYEYFFLKILLLQGYASIYPIKVFLYYWLCIHNFFWFIAGYQSHNNLQICIAVMHIKLNMRDCGKKKKKKEQKLTCGGIEP